MKIGHIRIYPNAESGFDVILRVRGGILKHGTFPDIAIQRYKAMGDWLKVYGETIYGTRGGLVTPRDWGVTTQKGNTLFVHILNLKDKSLYLPTNGKKVKSARVFVDKKPVKFTQDADGILLKLDKAPDELDYVVEVELR